MSSAWASPVTGPFRIPGFKIPNTIQVPQLHFDESVSAWNSPSVFSTVPLNKSLTSVWFKNSITSHRFSRRELCILVSSLPETCQSERRASKHHSTKKPTLLSAREQAKLLAFFGSSGGCPSFAGSRGLQIQRILTAPSLRGKDTLAPEHPHPFLEALRVGLPVPSNPRPDARIRRSEGRHNKIYHTSSGETKRERERDRQATMTREGGHTQNIRPLYSCHVPLCLNVTYTCTNMRAYAQTR